MLAVPDLRRILPTLKRTPLPGPWYRAVAFDYLLGPPPGSRAGSPPQPLWPGGARRRGARFTPRADKATPSFGSIYLGLPETTPLLEVAGILKPPSSPTPLVFEPQVLMTVDGVLTDILDLTDPGVQSALGTTLQELTGDWLTEQEDFLAGKARMPPTQVLGQAAFDVGGIVGLKYRSSKSVANGIGIVVYSDRLVTGRHYLQVFNKASGRLQQRLP